MPNQVFIWNIRVLENVDKIVGVEERIVHCVFQYLPVKDVVPCQVMRNIF